MSSSEKGAYRSLPEHPHPVETGMVIGTKCNVCEAPLIAAGCPLCVTCCEREP